MKKFKTYGKHRIREDMLTSKWDNIVNSSSESKSESRDESKLDSSIEIMNDVFSNLLIGSSTPKCKSDCSFKCRRSISLVSSNKKQRKRLSVQQAELTSFEDCIHCSANDSLLKEIFTSSNHAQEDMTEKLLQLCDERRIIDLNDYINNHSDIFVKKLGEGSYGEVFEKRNIHDESLSVKIVPVGKDTLVNGWEQMKLEEIISEMAVTRKLSNFAVSKEDAFYTQAFIQLHRLLFCKGVYPQTLIELWDDWHQERISENDHPEIFNKEQTYVVFETENGGVDLESYKIKTVKEGVSILKQLIVSIAAAEVLYKFEHRDLHHGNILIQKTSKKYIQMCVSHKCYSIESAFIKVSIIDFTMSRLETDGGVIFSDISNEESFFTGQGDIQFQVYRDMKKHNKNNWEEFNPYTNVLWIKYVAEKVKAKLRKNATILNFIDRVLNYSSCKDILDNDCLFL